MGGWGGGGGQCPVLRVNEPKKTVEELALQCEVLLISCVIIIIIYEYSGSYSTRLCSAQIDSKFTEYTLQLQRLRNAIKRNLSSFLEDSSGIFSLVLQYGSGNAMRRKDGQAKLR